MQKAENEAKELAASSAEDDTQEALNDDNLVAQETTEVAETEDVIEEVSEDPLLREAGRVLADFADVRTLATPAPIVAAGSSQGVPRPFEREGAQY